MKLKFNKAEMFDTMCIEKACTEGLSPFKMSKWSLLKGSKSPIDLHNVKEYWLVVQGKGMLNYKNESMIEIEKGDFIFMESNHSHQVESIGDIELIVYSIWW